MTKLLKNVDLLKKMDLKSIFMLTALFLDQVNNFFYIIMIGAKLSTNPTSFINFEYGRCKSYREPAELIPIIFRALLCSTYACFSVLHIL